MHWKHRVWKIKVFFKDDNFIRDGGYIPCEKCGTKFFSYCHFNNEGGYSYDAYCKCCEKDQI